MRVSQSLARRTMTTTTKSDGRTATHVGRCVYFSCDSSLGKSFTSCQTYMFGVVPVSARERERERDHTDTLASHATQRNDAARHGTARTNERYDGMHADAKAYAYDAPVCTRCTRSCTPASPGSLHWLKPAWIFAWLVLSASPNGHNPHPHTHKSTPTHAHGHAQTNTR